MDECGYVAAFVGDLPDVSEAVVLRRASHKCADVVLVRYDAHLGDLTV